MATSIRLFRGTFGHVSVLNVSSDFVTHAHAEAHIILWLDGAAGEMTIGHEKIQLGPQVAAGINSFQPHSHALSADGRVGRFLAFYIDPGWFSRRRGVSNGEPVFACATIPVDAWLHRAAVALYEDLDAGNADDLAAYEIERLIDSLADAADSVRPRSGRALAGEEVDFRVRKAIDLMKANVCERICFDEVAKAVGLSRPHFFALFKEQTSLTPNVYWNTLRMQEALKQLQWSREPLTSVAWNLGFTTQGNFTRFFRDHVGVPPTLYREAVRSAA
ncbi:MAG: helix-turn-helix transcriptional regulator [Rhizobiaceae bacterium]|nr:helix-turn-helix transcriptional regulator [Rhizobiaceae bacterium]